GATHRLSGRARDNRLVHLAPVDARPGDVVDVEVTYAAPHHLVADGPALGVRRTRAGDAWEQRTRPVVGRPPVLLGLPPVGRPATRLALRCRRRSVHGCWTAQGSPVTVAMSRWTTRWRARCRATCGSSCATPRRCSSWATARRATATAPPCRTTREPPPSTTP